MAHGGTGHSLGTTTDTQTGDNRPFRSSGNLIYTYPTNLEDHDYAHVVTFFFMVDMSRNSSSLVPKINADGETIVSIRDRGQTGAISTTARSAGAIDSIGASLGFNRPRIVRSTTSVSMFIPDGNSVKSGHEWTEAATGGIISSLLGTGAGGEDVSKLINASKIKGGVSVSSTINAIKSAASAGQKSNAAQALKIETSNALGAIGGVGAVGKGIVRQAFNPRIEFLYASTAPRDFTYNFKMIPRNEQEADTIHTIVRLFREHSHPSVEDKYGNFLNFPEQFEIEYSSYGKTNTYLNKISTCVLTAIDVNFDTESSLQFLRHNEKGSPPLTTTMSLTFKETEILTANRIREGF
jgi:hypothetical protein